jgi:hypothetical protein
MDGTYLANLCTLQAEPEIVVAIARVVVVAVGRTQVLRIIVPTAAPDNAVRARNGHHANLIDLSNSFRLREREFA